MCVFVWWCREHSNKDHNNNNVIIIVTVEWIYRGQLFIGRIMNAFDTRGMAGRVWKGDWRETRNTTQDEMHVCERERNLVSTLVRYSTPTQNKSPLIKHLRHGFKVKTTRSSSLLGGGGGEEEKE